MSTPNPSPSSGLPPAGMSPDDLARYNYGDGTVGALWQANRAAQFPIYR